MITFGPHELVSAALQSGNFSISLLGMYWTPKALTDTGNQGLIPESEPEKRLTLPRKAAGAKITQCENREVVTKNMKGSAVTAQPIQMRRN